MLPAAAPHRKHVFHQYTILLEGVDREGLKNFLSSKGIPSMIYYPVPGHRQKMFEHFGTSSANLPVTDWLTERVISLPVHTELDEEQRAFITSNVLTYLNA